MLLQERVAKIRKDVEELLSLRWGNGVSLGNPEPFDDGHGAHRLQVLNGSSMVPRTIVVKIYELELPKRREAFLRESAGWQFLHEVRPEPESFPQCYGSSTENGYIVLEDLYGWEKTSMLLRGDWSDRTETEPMPSLNGKIASCAMSKWWQVLGRIHATTIGKRTIYEEIRASLGNAPTKPLAESQTDQLAHRFRVLCKALNVSPHPQSEADLGTAMQTLLHPGPFESFTHGDPGAPNALYKDNVCKIIDLEESGYRNALLDATHIHTHFPTSWCAGRLPEQLVEELDAVYRKELSKGCPLAKDDELFYRSVADISVVSAVKAWQPWTGTNLIEEDKDWGLATVRQRFMARLDNAVSRTQKLGYLEGIGSTFESVLNKLRALWPPEVHNIPYFAAFEDQ